MRTRTVALLVAIPMAAVVAATVVLPPGGAGAAGLQDQMPRDLRPGQAPPPTDEERRLQMQVDAAAADAPAMLELAKLQERRGAIAEAEATLQQLGRMEGAQPAASHALAALYTRAGHFDRAVQTLEQAAALDPAHPSGHHLVATYYFEKLKDAGLPAADRHAYIEHGLTAADRALAADPDFFEALVYKNLLLREQAAGEPDPDRQRALISEADALRIRAVQVRRDAPTHASTGSLSTSTSTSTSTSPSPSPPPPPPPPPPPVPGAGDIQWVYAETSYTSTGSSRALAKVKDVRPVYPPMAIRLGVRGTVVVEAALDERGRVADVRVVESVPLLNQSAIDAVRQWQFDPATLDGAGGPVVITVTATFVPPR